MPRSTKPKASKALAPFLRQFSHAGPFGLFLRFHPDGGKGVSRSFSTNFGGRPRPRCRPGSFIGPGDGKLMQPEIAIPGSFRRKVIQNHTWISWRPTAAPTFRVEPLWSLIFRGDGRNPRFAAETHVKLRRLAAGSWAPALIVRRYLPAFSISTGCFYKTAASPSRWHRCHDCHCLRRFENLRR